MAPDRVADAVQRRLDELGELQASRAGRRRAASATARVDELLAAALDVAGATLVAGEVEVGKPDDLLALADEVARGLPDAAVALLAASTGASRWWWPRPTPSSAAGCAPSDVLAAMMPAIDGRGGGKPTLARGGGTRRRAASPPPSRRASPRLGSSSGAEVRLLALDYGVARTGVADLRRDGQHRPAR